MLEENVKKQIVFLYMSFGFDVGFMVMEGVFLKFNFYFRVYGNFSCLLGKYVCEEKVILLEEVIYKFLGLFVSYLKLKNRGLLKLGYVVDIVIFDLNMIIDYVIFE